VLEVDGPSHESDEQRDFDAYRDVYLRERGWRIMRVKNYEVFQSLREVEDAIWNVLEPGGPE